MRGPVNTKGFVTACTIILCVAISFSSTAQRKVRPFNHNQVPAPKGMVYIPGGTITVQYGIDPYDSSNIKRYSLSSFFIDKTEVTNKQYREFVNWVIDSIAVTEYLQDPKYFSNDIRDSSHYFINWRRVKHRRLWNDPMTVGALQPLFENGDIRKDAYQFEFKYLKSKGDKKQKEWVTESVNVYPDEAVWANDFPNSQTDLLVAQYFTNKAYDDYPVVGITWKQARAYAYWRTMVSNDERFLVLKDFDLPYTLPSEAQWVLAAQGIPGMQEHWIGPTGALRYKDSTLAVNFKQSEGVYTEDGSAYTVPVMSYAPNDFNLYNMLGNVAEWVLDAYNGSTWAFVHDQNPVLLYDADSNDSDFMKRKVVRGGSWKDNASSLTPYSRDYEVQDVPHSYIGFRCVMAAPEVLGKQVATRKRKK